MIDDEMLMAFVDGELNAVERPRVEDAVAEDAGLRARLETQQRLRARLAAHYAPVAEEAVPERLKTMLQSNIADFAAAKARRARPLWQPFAALAATLVLGLAIGRAVEWPGGGPVGVKNGTLIAEGSLAEALDGQLASTQDDGAATAIGVTFVRADGQPCRTFSRRDLAGLACHEPEGWRLVVTTQGTAPGREYRQAASGSALVMQAAQELMAGEPFDAEAERRARDSGWRRSPASR